MFKVGDIIQRKQEHYDNYWKVYCREQGIPINHTFYVVDHIPEDDVVRFKNMKKGINTVYDYKMELANFTLENE